MNEEELDSFIGGWKKVKTGLFTIEYAKMYKAALDSLAEGKAISIQSIGEMTGISDSSLRAVWEKFLHGGARFSQKGEIIGLTLSLEPSATIVTIRGKQVNAWCAFDALFVGQMLNEETEVKTLSPINGEEIEFIVGPTGIREVQPNSAAISMERPPDDEDSEGISCSLNHFFGDLEKANQWSATKENTAILDPQQAWRVAKEAWVDPFMEALNEDRSPKI